MVRIALLFVSVLLVACASDDGAEKDDAPAAEPAEPAQGSAEAEVEAKEAAPESLPGEATLAEGVIVAGQPTAEQLKALPDRGIELVVNVRGEDEPGFLADEAAIVEGAGMSYVHWDAGKGADALTEENAKKLGEALDKGGPVLVHCGSGNRAAALYALKTVVVDGKSAEEATELVEESGNDKLLEKLREALAARASE